MIESVIPRKSKKKIEDLGERFLSFLEPTSPFGKRVKEIYDRGWNSYFKQKWILSTLYPTTYEEPKFKNPYAKEQYEDFKKRYSSESYKLCKPKYLING